MSDPQQEEAANLAVKIANAVPDGVHKETVITALFTVLVIGAVPDYSRDELHHGLDMAYNCALETLARQARGH